MVEKRICPKCGEELKRQKGWHYRRDPKGWRGRSWCIGPRQVPLPPSKTIGAKKPVHYRDFASRAGDSLCGLHGGRTHGKYKGEHAQVPWTRIKVDLTQTTCEQCLVLVIRRSKERLHKRLQAIKAPKAHFRKIIQDAHGRRRLKALHDLVIAR